MRTYAQISGGHCVAITRADEEPTPAPGDLFVELPSYDTTYLGRAYIGGVWA